jgi:hypothetical protein
MQAKIDAAAKTLTIQYEDDIDLLLLWAYLNLPSPTVRKSLEDATRAKLMSFFGGTYPVWNELDEHLLAVGIISRPSH